MIIHPLLIGPCHMTKSSSCCRLQPQDTRWEQIHQTCGGAAPRWLNLMMLAWNIVWLQLLLCCWWQKFALIGSRLHWHAWRVLRFYSKNSGTVIVHGSLSVSLSSQRGCNLFHLSSGSSFFTYGRQHCTLNFSCKRAVKTVQEFIIVKEAVFW